jgi:hypothetical protein
MKQRKDAAFEAFFRITDSRPTHLDGATHHAEVTGLSVSVPIHAFARSDVSFGLAAANKRIHLFFEQFLNEILHVGSGPAFQSFVRID